MLSRIGYTSVQFTDWLIRAAAVIALVIAVLFRELLWELAGTAVAKVAAAFSRSATSKLRESTRAAKLKRVARKFRWSFREQATTDTPGSALKATLVERLPSRRVFNILSGFIDRTEFCAFDVEYHLYDDDEKGVFRGYIFAAALRDSIIPGDFVLYPKSGVQRLENINPGDTSSGIAAEFFKVYNLYGSFESFKAVVSAPVLEMLLKKHLCVQKAGDWFLAYYVWSPVRPADYRVKPKDVPKFLQMIVLLLSAFQEIAQKTTRGTAAAG